MAETRLRIIRYDSGSWVVCSPGVEQVSFRANDRAETIARARRMMRTIGGGDIHVLDREGRLERVLLIHRP